MSEHRFEHDSVELGQNPYGDDLVNRLGSRRMKLLGWLVTAAAMVVAFFTLFVFVHGALLIITGTFFILCAFIAIVLAVRFMLEMRR